MAFSSEDMHKAHFLMDPHLYFKKTLDICDSTYGSGNKDIFGGHYSAHHCYQRSESLSWDYSNKTGTLSPPSQWEVWDTQDWMSIAIFPLCSWDRHCQVPVCCLFSHPLSHLCCLKWFLSVKACLKATSAMKITQVRVISPLSAYFYAISYHTCYYPPNLVYIYLWTCLFSPTRSKILMGTIILWAKRQPHVCNTCKRNVSSVSIYLSLCQDLLVQPPEVKFLPACLGNQPSILDTPDNRGVLSTCCGEEHFTRNFLHTRLKPTFWWKYIYWPMQFLSIGCCHPYRVILAIYCRNKQKPHFVFNYELNAFRCSPTIKNP